MEFGQQVIYVPDHIKDAFDFGYPNGAQPGFITGRSEGGDYFVRYWRIKNGKPVFELRTKANAELTPDGNLRALETVPQDWVEIKLMEIFNSRAGREDNER